jgi:hypothetical protein
MGTRFSWSTPTPGQRLVYLMMVLSQSCFSRVWESVRRLAKIICLLECQLGYHLWYAKPNDTSHQNQVYSARTALG